MAGRSGTVGSDQTVNAGSRIVIETQDLFVGTTWTGQMKRANTLTTTRYVGLTADGAGSYVTDHKDDGTIQDLTSERVDESGQYVVVKVDIEYGTWA
jgi:hypothetical protein